MNEGFGRLSRLLAACAGLLGASGVALGAAGAHLGGGDLARLASLFLLLHGAAVVAILALPVASERLRCGIGGGLALGSALFSADLGTHGLTGHALASGMAPAGGSLLILAWLSLCGVALFGVSHVRRLR